MNKKILSLLFASILVLGACGGDNTETDDQEEIEYHDPREPIPLKIDPDIKTADYKYVEEVSNDGETLFANGGNQLFQSVDYGNSWTKMKDFGQEVKSIRYLADNQLLVSLRGEPDGSARGKVIKSTNYNKGTPEKIAFKLVIELSKGDVYTSGWGVTVHEEKALVAEYGMQGKAHKAYYSIDNGDSFKKVFDLSELDLPNPDGAHLHATGYDKWYDRWYISNGDGGNNAIYYSDDSFKTWTKIDQDLYQPTSFIAFESGMVMGTDSFANGILRIPRTNKEDEPYVVEQENFEEKTKMSLVGGSITQSKKPDSPAYISFTTVGTGQGIIASTVDGVNFFEIYRTEEVKTMQGIYNCIPMANGKLIGSMNDSRQSSYSQFTVDEPKWSVKGRDK